MTALFGRVNGAFGFTFSSFNVRERSVIGSDIALTSRFGLTILVLVLRTSAKGLNRGFLLRSMYYL